VEHAAGSGSSQIELIMNVNRAERAETWCEAVILAANEQLELMYRQHASACIALQISRNYRLLLTHNEHPLKKQHWRALSQRWLLSYQLHRGQQRGLPDMLESL
jgi:hypothetical protein|tara:strand:- start:41060 stop:41371 length:312 start_codon:yes stop_codon:yes gene_type:complete